MKKILISTYCHWTSFGSILQSLGFQKAIENIGAKATTITFASEEVVPAVKKAKIGLNRETVNYIYQSLNRKRLEQGKKRCLNFMDQHICRAIISEKENLLRELPDADAYIAGSDQIWHPALCREDFFLSYAPEVKKRISYAASMGVLSIPEQNVERFGKLLQNFDSFSVREEEMLPIIRRYTDKTVLQHIDPTFLISADEWRQYESAYDIQEPYILVYALYWDQALNKQLKELHGRTGYRIVSIQNSFRPIYANDVVKDAGPAEFLWLIDHAEAVITSSFHGTAFSVIFNKRFYPAVNPNAPSRIDSLLKMLHIHTPISLQKLLDFVPDYTKVNVRIEQEKTRSMDYLRREINGEE